MAEGYDVNAPHDAANRNRLLSNGHDAEQR
jgi:hypothetical protein